MPICKEKERARSMSPATPISNFGSKQILFVCASLVLVSALYPVVSALPLPKLSLFLTGGCWGCTNPSPAPRPLSESLQYTEVKMIPG